jgi:hypothetical protein
MSTALPEICKQCGRNIAGRVGYHYNDDGPFCAACATAIQQGREPRPPVKKDLLTAITELYNAGHWTCPDIPHEEQVRLWTQVRDAAWPKEEEQKEIAPVSADCEWECLYDGEFRRQCDNEIMVYEHEERRPRLCPGCGGNIVEV